MKMKGSHEAPAVLLRLILIVRRTGILLSLPGIQARQPGNYSVLMRSPSTTHPDNPAASIQHVEPTRLYAHLICQMEKIMKKRFIPVFVATTTLVAAFAAGTANAQAGTLTRAQVRAEIVQLHEAGYNVSRGEDNSYPTQLQAAEQRIAANRQGEGAAGYGANPAARSEAGGANRGIAADENRGLKPVYFGS